MARKYKLSSSDMVCAPGVFRMALNEIQSEDSGRQVWGMKLLMSGFPLVPGGIVVALIQNKDAVTVEIDDKAETVMLICTDEQEAKIGLPTN